MPRPLASAPADLECAGRDIGTTGHPVQIRPCPANFHVWACNATRTVRRGGVHRRGERLHKAKALLSFATICHLQLWRDFSKLINRLLSSIVSHDPLQCRLRLWDSPWVFSGEPAMA